MCKRGSSEATYEVEGKPTNSVAKPLCHRRLATFGAIAVLSRTETLAHAWSNDFPLIARPAAACGLSKNHHHRRRPLSTTPTRGEFDDLLLPGPQKCSHCVTKLDASSWGDEGEYFCDDTSCGDTAGGVDADSTESRSGRMKRVGKRIALLSAVGLSILGEGYIQSIAGSALAITAGFKLSKLFVARKESNDVDEDKAQPRRNKGNDAKRWLKATMGNLDRIDKEVGEAKRLDMERKEAERIARGKEWARQSLQTTDELKRRADEARREEARALKWANDMIQQDMQRQRNADIARFGKGLNSDDVA